MIRDMDNRYGFIFEPCGDRRRERGHDSTFIDLSGFEADPARRTAPVDIAG